ncbi:hypothetical protein GCM10008904_31610 [Paraclostridium ghonii]|uniref:Uncharacterized protein n=1 Tax=Paraclostridium ghonii TaxID=29358 RepID=A0ABU0MX03_9FIRM|nr:hypothetical protein [Paeniclostridium ghonii]MDQ0555435.1 hypothetical protein [Paeniclostridium ghonii]
MWRLKTRKCHKCKYTLKSKNFVQFKNGKPICDIYKNGIPDEIFFKARYCKNFELAKKYNIVKMVDNFVKKLQGCKECKKSPKISDKKSRVISINKDIK